MDFAAVKYESALCLCGRMQPSAKKVQVRDKFSGLMFEYERCLNCGLDVLNPRPTAADIGGFYQTTYYAYQSGYGDQEQIRRWLERLIVEIFYASPARRSLSIRLLSPLLKVVLWPLRRWPVLAFPEPEYKSVFEIGAAAGSDLMSFERAGWTTGGCEPSALACEVAAKRGFNLQCCLAEDANIEKDSCTLIFMNNVFEHLHQPDVVLRKVRLGLRNGGHLILVVPNHHSWSAKLLGAYWAGFAEAPKHIYGYSPPTLRRLLGEYGFSISYIQHRPAIQWLWVSSASTWLNDHGVCGRMNTWLSKIFALVMIPFSLLAAWCRHADFIKVVATKDAEKETLSNAALAGSVHGA